MPVYKSKRQTTDKRSWYFTFSYKAEDNNYKKYVSKNFLTKSEAEQELARFRTNFNMFENSNNHKTIKELAYEYLEYNKDKVRITTTIDNEKIIRLYILNTNIDKIKIDKLTMKELNHFRNKIPDRSVTYKNKIIKVLKAINNWNYKMYDYKNPYIDKLEIFKDNRIKKEMDFYTIDEFNLFIEQIDEMNYKALFTTLFYCGLRRGEALALTWNDIKNDEINITKSLTSKIKGKEYVIMQPKTKSSIRTLPIPNQVKIALKEWYNETNKAEGFNEEWFVFRDFRPIKESTLNNIKNETCKKANIKQIRLHDFRHSTASLLINNGANINLVSNYLGHKDIKMTLNTYSHLYESELKNIVEKINNM